MVPHYICNLWMLVFYIYILGLKAFFSRCNIKQTTLEASSRKWIDWMFWFDERRSNPFTLQIYDNRHPLIELEQGDVKLQQHAIIISNDNDIKIVLISKLLIFFHHSNICLIDYFYGLSHQNKLFNSIHYANVAFTRSKMISSKSYGSIAVLGVIH